MPKYNLTVADGQVAASATQITAGVSDNAKRYNLTFCNVGTAEETLVLTISRDGGTSRRLRRVVLAVNEQFDVCGLPLNATDSLLGATSNASSVDYVVSMSADDAPLTMTVYDDTGAPKSSPAFLEQLITVLG